MRKHKYIGLAIMVAIIAVPFIAFGAGITSGFGGMVLTTGKATSSVITCAAQYGPFSIRPYSLSPSAPYFIQAGLNGAPKTAGYILGVYNVIPDFRTCVNTETGVPVPAFRITTYGVSR